MRSTTLSVPSNLWERLQVHRGWMPEDHQVVFMWRDIEPAKPNTRWLYPATYYHAANEQPLYPIKVSLDRAAYEKLDERHYTVSFPFATKIHLHCTQDSYKTLQGSFRAVIPHRCYIETPQFTIINQNDRVQGQALKLLDLVNNTAITPTSAPELKLQLIHLIFLIS